MGATDELRSLLEQRGIKWEAPTGSLAGIRTIWSDGGWDMQADEAMLGWFDVEAFRYASSPQAAAETPSARTATEDVRDNRPMTATDEPMAYKTKVVLNLQGTSLVYLSPDDSETVICQLVGGHPVFLQTFDGHCAIINPNQIPAIEVYDQ